MKVSQETQEVLDFYGEQLEMIKDANAIIEVEKNILFDLNKSLRRENGILICFVISLALWIATS